MILFLLVLTATFHPAQPTVGDLITIEFPQAPVVLEAAPDYEIVSQQGKRVVVRTFEPKPFVLNGRAGDVAFRNMVVPVRSVLTVKDAMTPSPLRPPRPEPYPKMPFVLIGAAALLAIAVWIAVVILARRTRASAAAAAAALSAPERFRRTIVALQAQPGAMRWAALADALRVYLDATTPLSANLTTTEVLRTIGGAGAADPLAAAAVDVARILRNGDLEKFAPRAVASGDFDAAARAALALAEPPAAAAGTEAAA